MPVLCRWQYQGICVSRRRAKRYTARTHGHDAVHTWLNEMTGKAPSDQYVPFAFGYVVVIVVVVFIEIVSVVVVIVVVIVVVDVFVTVAAEMTAGAAVTLAFRAPVVASVDLVHVTNYLRRAIAHVALVCVPRYEDHDLW